MKNIFWLRILAQSVQTNIIMVFSFFFISSLSWNIQTISLFFHCSTAQSQEFPTLFYSFSSPDFSFPFLFHLYLSILLSSWTFSHILPVSISFLPLSLPIFPLCFRGFLLFFGSCLWRLDIFLCFTCSLPLFLLFLLS